MGRRKKSKVVNPNPPKQKAANRRKAKRDPIAEFYAAREEEHTTVRSKRPRKTGAVKRKRSGAAARKRGKRVAPRKAVNRRA